jgi:hypothetical protein
MATKTRRTADDFVRDIRARHAGLPLPPPTHNTPGLPALTEQEHVYVEGAREALASLRKTFDFWIAIARGLKALHDKADLSGGKITYDRLREREGLGKDVINKTRSSRLLAILDNLTAVGAWRDSLTEKQRFAWASPEAVHIHCPIFAKPKPAATASTKPAGKTTKAATVAAPVDGKIVEDLKREVAELKEKLKAASKQQRQPDGDFEALRSAYAAGFASKVKKAKDKAAQERASKEEQATLVKAISAAMHRPANPLAEVGRQLSAALNATG